MINNRWLVHDEFLIINNAAVHTGKDSKIVNDLLWDTVIDGKPLKILVVYLPLRCLELNPIKKIFYILSKRVRQFWEDQTTDAAAVLQNATSVMNDFSFELIEKTINSCSYYF